MAITYNGAERRNHYSSPSALNPVWGSGVEPPPSSRLTFQLQADEVGVAKVLQEDAVGGAGLEVEGDVGAGLALEGGEVEVGRRRGERGGVPVVVCGKEDKKKKKHSHRAHELMHVQQLPAIMVILI